MKQFFQTKFKVLPVYKDMKKCGVIVYAKPWYCPFYMSAVLDVLDKDGIPTTAQAYFKEADEAFDYINSRKTIC